MTYDELCLALKDHLVLSPAQIDALHRYALLLKEWNEKFNLTSIVEEPEVIEKHFYDSLIPAKAFSFDGKGIADLGTGAGFPGLVWAIAFPSSKVSLVDATGKKCTFLKAVTAALNLKNVTVINARAEELHEKNHFDVVSARAVAPLSILLEMAIPLLKVHGTFIALKSSKGREELVLAKNAMTKLGCRLVSSQEDNLPSGEGLRLNFFFEKMSNVGDHYPRSWAEIEKKPL